MSMFELSIEELSNRLAGSFKAEIETALAAELRKLIDPAIKNIANRMATNISGKIRSYRQQDGIGSSIQILISIDGVSQAQDKL